MTEAQGLTEMRGPYNTNQVIVECDCDCATQCPQRRIGSSPKCMIVVERATLNRAVRELNRKSRPADFTLRFFGKTIFEGWL